MNEENKFVFISKMRSGMSIMSPINYKLKQMTEELNRISVRS